MNLSEYSDKSAIIDYINEELLTRITELEAKVEELQTSARTVDFIRISELEKRISKLESSPAKEPCKHGMNPPSNCVACAYAAKEPECRCDIYYKTICDECKKKYLAPAEKEKTLACKIKEYLAIPSCTDEDLAGLAEQHFKERLDEAAEYLDAVDIRLLRNSLFGPKEK